MKKISITLTLALLFIVAYTISVSAAPNIIVKSSPQHPTIIAESNDSATYTFQITNNGPTDKFRIYSLVGVTLEPTDYFLINTGETKTLTVTAKPNAMVRKNLGFVNFDYQIKGFVSGISKQQLSLKIVPFQSFLKIQASDISPNDDTTTITLMNTQNLSLENLKVNLKSKFFSTEKTISLNPYENKSFIVKLNKENSTKLTAGSYNFTANFEYNSLRTNLTGEINYLTEKHISTSENSNGFIIHNVKSTKTNNGNVPESATIELDGNIITRLFTTSSPSPTDVKRNGWDVTYYWQKNLAPGESLAVETTTNYTFPVILAILIVLIILFVRVYTLTAVSAEKKTSFVKTKGGQFALKVKVSVKARKHIDNVQILDTLPAGVKLYEKFGKKPDEVNEKTRRLTWNLGTMNAGEERVVSYIVYSKLNLVGRFELPAATIIYTLKNKTAEIFSNRAFFMSETRGKD